MPKAKSKNKDSQRSQSSSTKPTKKRLRIHSSDEEFNPNLTRDEERLFLNAGPSSSNSGKKAKKENRGEKTSVRNEAEILKLQKKLFKLGGEKNKILEKLNAKRTLLASEREKNTAADAKLTKLRKDISKLKKSNDRITKEKDEAVKEVRDEASKLKKKIDSLKQKTANLELEKTKLESKLSSLNIADDSEAGPSKASGSGGLFQDMMDNFRELAETQLQCAVCSEVFVEATSINCGHTFCHYCIYEWKKKKSNCPVCRTDIKQIVQCKVLDEYADKMYEQFVSEGGKLARASLKEERMKIKKDAEEAAAARSQERRARAERRRVDREASDDEDDNHDGPLEMVNLVMNRINRSRRILDDAEESVDSDATLELHLSDGDLPSDTDSEVDIVQRIGRRHRIILRDSDNSDIFDTDSDDDDFRASDQNRDNDDNDTDSLTDSTESNSSQSSSDSSSDSESD